MLSKLTSPLSILWTFLFISIGIIATGFVLEEYVLVGLPFALLIGYLGLTNYKLLFYLLLLVLPFSVELVMESVATSLPVEPIVAGLFLLALVILSFNYKRISTRAMFNAITVLLISQLFWILIASLFSINHLHSFKYLFSKLWYFTGFFIFGLAFLRNKDDFEKIFWILFIPTFLLVVISLVRYSFFDFAFQYVNYSIMPYFRNKVNYAVVLTLLYPFIWVMSIKYEQWSLRKIVLDSAKVIFLIGIFFSYTRSAILALAAGFACLVVMRMRSIKLATLAAILGAIGVVYYLSNDNKYLDFAPEYTKTIHHDRLDDHIEATFSGQDASGMERFYMWLGGLGMFKESPWTGYGPMTFYPEYKKHTVLVFETYLSENEERLTIHNYFLLMLVEQGIPGFLLFAGLVIVVLFKCQRLYIVYRDPHYRLLILGIGIFMVMLSVNLLLSDLIEAVKPGGLYLLMLAFLVNLDINRGRLDKPAGE